ncbi:MAG: translocation/assembly module TamB [Treponema sp.]|jgi:hypothetical protein|nr:translocation/assembly module TamB [Treponema sp.]
MSFKASPRSIYLKILVFCGLIGISAILLQPIQYALGSAMSNIRNDIIKNMEDAAGLEIRYSSIRPAFFGSFEIRNLRFYKEGRSFFTVSRASIRFSLPKLITGNKSAIHTINIDRPILRMDLQRDMDIFTGFNLNQNEKQSSDKIIVQQIAEYLPKSVNYVMRNCSLLLVDGSFVYKIDGMNIDIKGDREDILFDSSFDAEIRYSGFSDRSIIFNTNVDIKSISASNLNTANADIVLSSIVCSEQRNTRSPIVFFRNVSLQQTNLVNIFSLKPVNILLKYKDRTLSIEQILGEQDIDYSFQHNLETGTVKAYLNMSDYVIGSSINFYDYLSNASHLLDIAVSGNFKFSRDENGVLNYSVDYKGGDDNDGFSVRAYGGSDNLFLNEFYINASEATVKAGFFQGNINASGNMQLNPVKPQGNINFNNFSFTGKDSINANLEITSNDDNIRISANDFLMGSIVMDELSVNLYSAEKDIVILGQVASKDNSFAYVDAVINRKPGQLDAMLNLDSFSFFTLTGMFRPFVNFISLPDFVLNQLNNNKLDTEIYFSSNFKNMIYNAPNIIIKNDTVLGKLSLSGTDRQFNLSHGVFYLDNDELLISASSMFYNSMDIRFTVNASYQDTSWNVDGQLLDRTTLIIRDPNGLHVYGNVSNTGALSGYVEGINYPIPVDSSLLYLNFYTTLRFNNYEFWSVDVAFFEISDINSREGDVNFRITGSADQDGASFREILFNDSLGLLFGNADFSWDPDFSYLQFYINMTDGMDKGESYFFDGMLKNKTFRLNTEISNMHINRLFKGRNTMLASAEADITWDSIDSFNADINISSFYTNLNKGDIQASGGIYFTNNELAVHNLKIDYQEINAVIPIIQINRTESFAEFQANINGFVLDKIIDIQAKFNADFKKTDSWINITNALNLFDGQLVFDNFHYGDILYKDTEFVFSGNNGALSVSGGIDEMLRLEMDNLGNFYLGLSAPLPIRGSIAGTLSKDLMLDAHCSYFFIDMKSLWTSVTAAENEIGFSGGYIIGKVDIRGPVLNPEFFGVARGTSFNMQVPSYVANDIRPVPFNITAEGYEMTFGPVFTVCGLGGGTASGWFRFEFWAPRNIGIDINIPAETPIPYAIDIVGVIAEGDASGTLSLVTQIGDDNLIEIKGDIVVNNTEMGYIMIDQSGDEQEEPEMHSIVDFKITTGSTVEFFWPDKTTPLIKANPEMGTVISITADTLAQQFSIVSDINIRSGELNYLDRNFYIRQGTLVLRENENDFNPRITARAEIRDRVDSGPVIISLIVENQPLLSFEPRFEASPSLTQLEIYSLLGQNYNIQDSNNPEVAQRFLLNSTTDIVGQVIARYDFLGQSMILRQIEKQVRDFLNLDLLSFRTRIVQNFIVEGAVEQGFFTAGTEPVTGAGASPVDAARMGNYLDNTTVSIGKYIGQDMFIQGTLTMKYDENSVILRGIALEPNIDIGIEWRTPFVNIRWDIFPSNPQNWFITDNSITLSWSKSF